MLLSYVLCLLFNKLNNCMLILMKKNESNTNFFWCDFFFFFHEIPHLVFDFHCMFIKVVILPQTECFIHYPKGFSKSFKIHLKQGLGFSPLELWAGLTAGFFDCDSGIPNVKVTSTDFRKPRTFCKTANVHCAYTARSNAYKLKQLALLRLDTEGRGLWYFWEAPQGLFLWGLIYW